MNHISVESEMRVLRANARLQRVEEAGGFRINMDGSASEGGDSYMWEVKKG